MLTTELTKSGKFIVLERLDLNKLEKENALMGHTSEDFKNHLVGVDALIFGSISEFGRKDVGEVQLFSRSRQQIAHAKVNARLVDPRSGHTLFSEDGAADATLEQQTIHGLGDRATFDHLIHEISAFCIPSRLMPGDWRRRDPSVSPLLVANLRQVLTVLVEVRIMLDERVLNHPV